MTWAHYLIQVNIYLVIFYCFYKLLLDKETYFKLNRFYLISSGILSFAIPFMRFEWFSQKAVGPQLYQGVYELNNLVSNYAILPQTQAQYDWGRLIVTVYLIGVLFFVARFIYQLFAINKLLTAITSSTAFSFLNKKAVSKDLPALATINLHEDIHIKQFHTVDVLFFEVIGIITWFNPIIYIYKISIKNIHEYLADEAAAKFQGDKEMYSLLLLSKAFNVNPNQLTNGFFSKSMLKKRIFMLHKQRSKRTAMLKYGLFLPLFALTLVLSSASIRRNDQLLAATAKLPLTCFSDVKNAIKAPMELVENIEAELNQSGIKKSANKDSMKNIIKTALIASGTFFASQTNAQVDTLKGKVNGVFIVKDSVSNFKNLKGVALSSKSENHPMYVVDGVPVADANLSNINPNDIESIAVLKDAKATSLYGNKGANGVVLIVTKANATESQSSGKGSDATSNVGTRVVLRGNANGKTPLFYIDGKQVNESAYENLDPKNIEKVDVLKDAASISIYGDKAKDGVILVTTKEGADNQSSSQDPQNNIYNFVSMENPPTYPGGINKFYEYLGRNIRYPKEAVEKKIQGNVFLSFLVEKDGSLTNLKIERRLGYGTDEEAIRVVKSSPRWNPGMQKGKPVRVMYNIPIKFSLNK